MKASVLLVMAAAAVAAATGFLREAVVAYLFGTSATADAFSLILVYIEGLWVVVNVGIAGYMLVPLVVRLDSEGGPRTADRLLETLQLWTALLFLTITAAAWLAPAAAARAMAPGFNAIQHALLADMIPAAAVCAALLVSGALCGGVLQARGAYLGPLLGRGAFNLGIVAMLYANSETGTAPAAANGLLVGGLANALLQVVTLWRSGWRPAVPLLAHLHLGSAVASGLPTVLGLFLMNFVAVAVQRSIGSNLAEGSLAAVNYALRTVAIVAVLSASIGTVSLTGLSTAVARDPTGATARAALTRHLSGIAWLVVPLSMWLAVAAAPLLGVLFFRGAYTADSLVLTADCLRWFAAALVPGSMLMILQRAGSAWNRNWLTTFSSLGLALTSAGMTVFLLPLGATALPIAVFAGNLAAVLIQAWLMYRLIGRQVLTDTLGATAASGARSVVALAPLVALPSWFLGYDGSTFDLLWRLFAGLGVMAGLYVGLGLLTADKLTRELIMWVWDAVRATRRFMIAPRL